MSVSVSADSVSRVLAAADPVAALVVEVSEECALALPADPFAAVAAYDAIVAAGVAGWRGVPLPAEDAADYALALAFALGRAVAVARGWPCRWPA